MSWTPCFKPSRRPPLSHPLVATGLYLLAATLRAATPIPEGSTLVGTPAGEYTFIGNPPARAEAVTAESHPEWFTGADGITEAMLLTVESSTENAWSIQWGANSDLAVATGDVGLVRFYLRAVSSEDETGLVQASAVVQESTDPWTKSLQFQATAGAAWKEIILPFSFVDSYGAGETQLLFWLGGSRPQALLIAGVEAVLYGDAYTEEELPFTGLDYPGREPEAAWRASAQERIERFRKGRMEIRVVDRSGNPVPGVEVDARMTRHAFHWGTAVSARELIAGESRATYREKLLENFNAVTMENALKWPPYEGDWGAGYAFEELTLPALEWLRSRGLYTRGHVLVWPGLDNLPQSIRNAWDNDRDSIPAAVLAHIDDILTRTAGLLDEWDVLNEPVTNHDLMDAFGDDIMADWFERAAAHLPDTPRVLNDFSILSGGTAQSAHKDAFEAVLQGLLAAGAPVNALGFQGHFGSTVTPPEALLAVLDRFDAYGLPIRVTEFDITIDDPEFQADYLRDFLTAMFSWPTVEGVIQWGFWEGRHWRENAALYDLEWNLRPHGAVYRDLVFNQWWTDATGATDAEGRFAFDGFFGDYDLTLTGPNGTRIFELRPRAGDNAWTLVIDGVAGDPEGPLGAVRALGGRWLESPWLGTFMPGDGDWLYLGGPGWASARADGRSRLWLWIEALGWLLGSPHTPGAWYRPATAETLPIPEPSPAPGGDRAETALADSEPLWGSWLRSPWLGHYLEHASGWIRHAELGWLYPVPDGPAALWIYHPLHGWLWTTRNHFNDLYIYSTQEWIPATDLP